MCICWLVLNQFLDHPVDPPNRQGIETEAQELLVTLNIGFELLAVGEVHLHPNYGNPDGPATLSGAGKDYAVPGWTDEQTQYWIDNATGPKD